MAPVEGGKVTLLDYPQMPAGEQKVRITYKGNSDYRPSTSGETTITVKKAKVKVSVHSTNILRMKNYQRISLLQIQLISLMCILFMQVLQVM